jgi:peroxiredoxin-like protein
LTTDISIPANLGGPGVGTNPEELLLGAAAGCYLMTLCTLLTNRGISYSKIELHSEGYVEDDHGLRFDRIEHHPTIVVDAGTDEAMVKRLALHAEHACMVASALRGNVVVQVVPTIQVQTPAS